jgi:hypothetical protein
LVIFPGCGAKDLSVLAHLVVFIGRENHPVELKLATLKCSDDLVSDAVTQAVFDEISITQLSNRIVQLASRDRHMSRLPDAAPITSLDVRQIASSVSPLVCMPDSAGDHLTSVAHCPRSWDDRSCSVSAQLAWTLLTSAASLRCVMASA